MKKFVFGILVGGIIFGSMVYAYSYSASNITYIPSNENWNVHDVSSAIDSLKNSQSCKSWTKIEGATANNASYVFNNGAGMKLYKCNNICKISFELNNVSMNTEYPIITDSKYYPKEEVEYIGVGGGNGYSYGKLLTNGKIIVTAQGVGGTWNTANNVAFICE